MRAAVDDQRCRGHRACITICPEVFTLTDDGYAVAQEAEIPVELEATASEALESCPEQAITAE